MVFSSAPKSPHFLPILILNPSFWLFRNGHLSHIASGYWYNSANQGKVRVDETYKDAYGSSLFDYTNTSSSGGVFNHLITHGPAIGQQADCFADYVDLPGFPLVTEGFLKDANASFGGVVKEPFLGEVQSVSIFFDLCSLTRLCVAFWATTWL
jgi:hypothetical protein